MIEQPIKLENFICYRFESTSLYKLLSDMSDWLREKDEGSVWSIEIQEPLDDHRIGIYTGLIYSSRNML